MAAGAGPIDFLFDGPREGPLVMLAHGAGAPMDSPFMAAFAAGLAAKGLRVARFEFPYMQERRSGGGRRPPNPESTLLQTWRAAVGALGGGAHIVIGGKSMGGRMASMVADELGCRGLVCLGYPFHAPGRPERARTAHLATLRTPALVVQGMRDPFGSMQDVAGYALSTAIAFHWLTDGNHDFKPRGGSGRSQRQNWDDGIAAVAAFVAGLG